MNDEGDLVLLVLGQVLSVAEDAEAGHVGGGVGIVFVHEPGCGSIQARHGVDGTTIALADLLLADDQLDSVPAIAPVKPLVCIASNLGTQWFG